MKKLILVLVLLLVLSGCSSYFGYEGTLGYQEAKPFQCEAYYLPVGDTYYMVDSSEISDLGDYVGKEVLIKGEIVYGPYSRQCQYEKTIVVESIEVV